MKKPLTKRLRSLGASLLLLATTLLFLLGVFEVGLRLFYPQNIESPLDLFAADPSFGHVVKPNLDRKEVSTSEWTMHVSTNSKGFRAAEFRYDKVDGVTRIVGVGDSFMFGYGVERQENALERVGEALAAASGREIEAINLGIPGHGPTQYLDILRAHGLPHDPDLVITMFFLNDFRQAAEKVPFEVDGGFLVTEKFNLRSIRSALLPVRGFLKTHSHAYVFFRDRLTPTLQKLGLRPLEQPTHYRRDIDLATRYAYTLETIRAMHRSCAQRGVAFLLCLIPDKQQVLDWYRERVLESYGGDVDELDWNRPQTVLTEFCRTEGIECLDLAPPFREAGRSKPIYFEVDLHWNRDGHAVAAAEIVKRIGELGWLDRSAPR